MRKGEKEEVDEEEEANEKKLLQLGKKSVRRLDGIHLTLSLFIKLITRISSSSSSSSIVATNSLPG